MTFRAYRPADLPGLIVVWNDTFAGGPNFCTLTEGDFTARVTSQPSFDPNGLLIAESAGRIAGFVHFGRGTNFWFDLAERRISPSDGAIWALVAPAADRPLMQSLLHAALGRFSEKGVRRALFYPSWVQCTQPFYNGIAGAYEMPGLSTTRTELLSLLADKGFSEIAHYDTPEFELANAERLVALREESRQVMRRIDGSGMKTRVREVTSAFFPPRRVVDLVWGLETIALTAFGLWDEYAREHERKLYGITGVQVAKAWRGMGLGKVIMVLAIDAALEEGAEALHLHVYRDNRPAWNLYHRALGFQPRYDWITLAKDL